MEHNKPDQGHQVPGKGKGEQTGREERVGQTPPDRSHADDRGTIPDLPEPDVEGVGNEGRSNDLGPNRDQGEQRK